MGDRNGSALGAFMNDLENGNGDGFQTRVLLALAESSKQIERLEAKFDTSVASLKKDVEASTEKNQALINSTIDLIQQRLDFKEGVQSRNDERLKSLELFRDEHLKAQAKGFQTYAPIAIAALALVGSAFTGIASFFLK